MTQQYPINTAPVGDPATPSRPLVDWLEQQYDTPQRDHSGPEAVAWDGHGLKAMAAHPGEPNVR